MSVDPALIQAIRTAVEAQPDNHELRLHLAGLLIQAELPLEALEEARRVLAQNPAHLAALRAASEAAAAGGQPDLAGAYQKLADSLGWSQTQKLLEGLGPGDPPPGDGLEGFTKELEEALDEEGDDEDDEDDDEDDDQGEEAIRLAVEEILDSPEPEYEHVETTLKDVAGMEAVKRRIEVSFLAPMRNPELRRMFKKSLKGGLLLYGPPGCGKTHIARALAGELTARFISVSITDVMDMYVGQSERNLHEIFASARRLAPVVIFFDELDALGRKRSLMRESGGRTSINQLLQELDGLDSDNEGIYVLAATNHPWDVDAALRRPGRFDRTILVTPPDQKAREAILNMSLEGRPHDRIDLPWIAKGTEDYSGADMVHLVESATELAMEESVRLGRPRPVSMNDFKQALKEVRPSTKPWLDTARKYVVYGNDSGQWDELKEYLKARRLL